MKFNKIILPLSLFTTPLFANDEISYDYIGINYAYSGTNLHNDHSYSLDASFSINDNWYLSTDFNRLLIEQKSVRRNNLFTKNTYNLSLGFYKSISQRTDVFAELGYEHSRVSVPALINTVDFTGFENFTTSSNDIIGKIGIRTAFNNKFETTFSIKTGAKQYPIYQLWSPSILSERGYSQSGFAEFSYDDLEIEAFGLYRFNKNNALKFGFDSIDGYKVGWRYNWK